MQQRRLRPGDVLDDYCPRERRITDHAIVAMIGDDIKQTRCVSCDTEHEYKQGRVPARRKKDGGAALFGQVLNGLQPPARPAPSPPSDEAMPPLDAPSSPPSLGHEPHPRDVPTPVPPEPVPPPASSAEPREREDGPVRRPLIRAQLPRHDGQQPPARALPEFTVRQAKNGRTVRPGGPHRQSAGGGRAADTHGHGGQSRMTDRRQDANRPAGWSGNRADRGPRAARARGGKKR